jgi:CarD family transcriptional regulator
MEEPIMSIYKIGDKIVCPMNGAGVIESIEEKEVLGEIQQYYVVRIPIGDMKIFIPVRNAESRGIRGVINEEKLDQVLSTLKNGIISTNNITWNKRHKENMDKIRSGDIFEIANVVKSLVQKEHDKGTLSTGDRQVLNNAKQFLISELILSKNISQGEAENILNFHLKSKDENSNQENTSAENSNHYLNS